VGWNGKIIGGSLGLMFGGPVGALLGVLIGHQFDSQGIAPQAGPGAALRLQELFFPATFRVMGHIAKADGRVSEQEIAAARAVMAALRLDAQQVQSAIDYYGEGKQPQFSLEAALRELMPLMRAFPQLAQFFLEIQLQAAIAGNGLSELPRARLQRAAAQFGFDAAQLARLESLMRWRMGGGAAGAGPGSAAGGGAGASAQADADRLRQAYALLEVEPTVGNEQLTRAWRRQMSRNHPDKLQASGLPESMLERAKERTQQIQAAYELIKAARGMR
jgi:DnaJ like chaperone protein